MKKFVSQACAALLIFTMLLGLAPLSAHAADPQIYSKEFMNVIPFRGTSAKIETTDAAFGAKLEAAADNALVGTVASTTDPEYQTTKALFEQDYILSGDFDLVTWTLTLEDQTVTELPPGTTITYSNYSIVNGGANATIFSGNSSVVSAVYGATIVNVVGPIFAASFTVSDLGNTITIANNDFNPIDTTVTRTYSEAANRFFVQVTGSAADLPATGSVQETAVDAGSEEVAAIRQLLQAKYTGNLDFSVHDLALQGSAGEIPLPNDAQTTVTLRLITLGGNPYIYKYANGSLKKVTAEQHNVDAPIPMADFSFQTDNLSGIVILKSFGLTANRFSDFAAGTYRITANLYVKGQDNEVLPGVTAYLTNPNVPPVAAMQNNAMMTVDEDGDLTLTIDVLNAVFSLQHIEDGGDVHIVDSTYGADEGCNPDFGDRIRAASCNWSSRSII